MHAFYLRYITVKFDSQKLCKHQKVPSCESFQPYWRRRLDPLTACCLHRTCRLVYHLDMCMSTFIERIQNISSVNINRQSSCSIPKTCKIINYCDNNFPVSIHCLEKSHKIFKITSFKIFNITGSADLSLSILLSLPRRSLKVEQVIFILPSKNSGQSFLGKISIFWLKHQ